MADLRGKEDDAEVPMESAEVGEDCRILAILRDPQSQRWREWRSLCTDRTEPSFSDWPVEDGRSVSWLCRHMLKHGMTDLTLVFVYTMQKKKSLQTPPWCDGH